MLSVKNELLATLATALDAISPGAGAKAAFESPKVAAHGDFACTAAMQLAKPLKLNPRALGEQLKATLEATPAYQRWVDAIEIAGPGFLNIRLKPAAKQEVVREVLAAGARFGSQSGRLLLAPRAPLAAWQRVSGGCSGTQGPRFQWRTPSAGTREWPPAPS